MHFITPLALIRRIAYMTDDKNVFATILKRMEYEAKSDDDEFGEKYYEVLELHDTCGEMIELYKAYLKNLTHPAPMKTLTQ